MRRLFSRKLSRFQTFTKRFFLIHRLMNCLETGIYDHMKTLEIIKEEMIGRVRESERQQKHSPNEESNGVQPKQRAIKFKELIRGILLVYFSGNLLSTFILVIEIIYKNCKINF